MHFAYRVGITVGRKSLGRHHVGQILVRSTFIIYLVVHVRKLRISWGQMNSMVGHLHTGSRAPETQVLSTDTTYMYVVKWSTIKLSVGAPTTCIIKKPFVEPFSV